MNAGNGQFAVELRRELCARNRVYARRHDLPHVESYGQEPVVVYRPFDNGLRHGNFMDASYAAIRNIPEWSRRLDKIHAQSKRSLPRVERPWRELDSCTSSDALLMNIFCHPDPVSSAQLRNLMGLEGCVLPQFGYKARVPLTSGLLDRTEVDMKIGPLLVEAKLTESDFQTKHAGIVESYRDFDQVFDKRLLPRRWRKSGPDITASMQSDGAVIQLRPEKRRQNAPAQYLCYQLIRNVLAAHANSCSFCVMLDDRRPDLIEACYAVMRAIEFCDLRIRCKVLTWQELSAVLPMPLQQFLASKYGIVCRGSGPRLEVGGELST